MNADDQPDAALGALVAPDAVRHVVERAVAGRVEAGTKEVRRLVAATFAVIERTGSTDVSLRAVLAASGWSNQAFYRYFESKDDLLVALLLSGLRRLADELRQRMIQASDPAQRVEAWISCVLEQASDPRTAALTRPFIAGLGRLEVRFPDELNRSRDLLTATLADALPGEDRTADAGATYDLAFGAMQRHLLARTRPAPAEVAVLVSYAQRALGVLYSILYNLR